VAEFTSYLDLKAGATLFAFNSDDGFVATSAPNPHDTLGTLLGYYNGGRGNANPLPLPTNLPQDKWQGTTGNSVFAAVVPEDGVYPVRILYWQGGGGINGEFFSIDKGSGTQTLVNDLSTGFGVPAYTGFTGTPKAWVEFSVSPTPWDNRKQQAGPGPLLFTGRTPSDVDASDQYNRADDARPFADTAIGAVFADAAGKTIGMQLNGTAVTPSVTTSGTNTVVSYKPAALLPSGSTNVASLIYEGVTNSWPFVVQTYTNIPGTLALDESAADTSARGFRARVVKARNNAGLPTTVDRAEAQLAGTLIDPATTQPYTNAAVAGPESDGSYLIPGVINWNQEMRGGNSVEIGNFRSASTHPVEGSAIADDPIPGIGLGTLESTNSNDQIAAEVTAWLDLPAGYVKLGVNSDDGFRVYVSTNYDTNAIVLGDYNAGGGSSDVPFSFTVEKAGLYPIRLVWFEGGGGANLEFFSYGPNNQKIEINDPNNPNAIKAYYRVTGGGGNPDAPVISTAREQNGDLTITWTNGGTLQGSPTLGSTANWTTVDSDGSYTTTPSTGIMFFRVVK
jgi:hypothetical protein